MHIVMRIVASFVLRCQYAAASGRDRSRARRVVYPSLPGEKKYYFIHPVSFHSSGHCSVAKTRGSISTKILINGEGDVNELEWRAVTWAQWGRNKNTESWPWYWKYPHSAVQEKPTIRLIQTKSLYKQNSNIQTKNLLLKRILTRKSRE